MKVNSVGLLILLALALAVPTLAQTKSKPEKKDDRVVTASPVIEGDPMIPADRISIHDLKAKLDAKADVLILDVRANEGWNSSTTKIKGAIRVAFEEVEKKMSEWKKAQEIIAYCSWPDEATSASVVRTLQKAGFKNVKALLGGWNAWVNVNYPTEAK